MPYRLTSADAAERATLTHDLRSFAETLPAPISYVDRELLYRFNNHACEDWFGIPAAQIAGRSVDQVPALASYAGVRGHALRALAGEVVRFETVLPGRGHVDVSYIPDMRDGEARGYFAHMSGRRPDPEAVMSELLAGMGHDLRTPLNAVVGLSELLYDGSCGGLTDEQRECVGDILNSGRQLARLINAVIDLARFEAGHDRFEPAPADAVALAQETVDSFREAAAQRRITLSVDADPQLAAVCIDVRKFREILSHFLFAALKNAAEEGWVTVGLTAESRSMRIEVSRDGPGIPPEPGYGENRGGAGLGLILARRYVETQGGTCGIEAGPGGGSGFWAVIPRQLTSEAS